MKKYPKIKRLGHSDNDGILNTPFIRVQEKMDGANFRFTLEHNIEDEYHVEGRDLVFGSRNVVYKNEKDIDSAFQHAVDYVRENANIDQIYALDANHGPLTFYGEAMHSHTLDYMWDNTPSFIGFDVLAEDDTNHGDIFFASGDCEWAYELIELPTAPTIYEGHPEGFDYEEIPESEYRDGLAEGFTIKTQLNKQMAKVRSEQFKEMHGSSSGKTPEGHEPDDAKELAYQFATEARILKAIHKHRDRGRTIEMSIMEDLWREVFDDVIDEEYDTIFHGNHTIDTQKFRSEVAGRTADVLQQYLSRPEYSVLNEVPA